MADDKLDVVGRLLMENLRDESLEFVELLLQGHWKAPRLRKLQEDVQAMDAQAQTVLFRCVRAAVDAGIHSFLVGVREAVEEELVDVVVDGESVLELSDQLEGELFTEDGWQVRFSKYGEMPKEA